MKKRVVSALMSVVMAFTCMVALTLVVNTAAPISASATTDTKKAIYVGPSESGQHNIVNVFVPFNLKDYDSTTGQHYIKVKLKARMLGGTKPVLGRLIGASNGGVSAQYPSTTVNTSGNTTYNSSTGYFESDFISVWIGSSNQTYHSGQSDEKCEGITIGNAQHKTTAGSTTNTVIDADWNASFIFTDVVFEFYNSSKTLINSNIAPAIDEEHFNGDAQYFFRDIVSTNGACTGNEHLFEAPKDMWSIDTSYSKVKLIDVPADYCNGNSGVTFNSVAATSTTIAHYTSPSYSDLKFAALPGGGYEVISDITKKMVVISENVSGGRRNANIAIPLYLDQWWATAEAPNVASYRCYVKVTANIKRLSGSGKPMLTRVLGDTRTYKTFGSPACAWNTTSGESGLEYTTYNASTGEFVGWVRLWRGSRGQLFPNGLNEIVVIGNSEIGADSTDNSFTSSFAVTDIQLDLYGSDGSTHTSLVKSDIAPHFSADTLNDDSYAYIGASSTTTSHSDDNGRSLARASGRKWSVCGDPYMVNVYDVTSCFASGHSVSHNPETSTSIEHYHCATCGKNYADPYGNVEIADISAAQKLILVRSTGATAVNAIMPLDFQDAVDDSDGDATYNYYLFRCKMKIFGDKMPVLSVMRADDSSIAGAWTEIGYSTYGTGSPLFTSYDDATGIYTAVIKLQISDGNDYDAYSRREPNTMAHHAILLGNGKYQAGYDPRDTSYFSSFAFTNPELYKLSSMNDPASITGNDLCANVTDKSLNTASTYRFSAAAGSADRSVNNVMAAPVGKWSFTSTYWAINNNIPEGFFEGTVQPKMLKWAGYNSSSSQIAVRDEVFLEKGATYQFDMDYRAFNGTIPYISLCYSSGSYADAVVTPTADNVDGSHMSVQFTMPSDARTTGDGNFRLCLGINWEGRNMSNVYYANLSLCKVEGGVVTGRNRFASGDFAFGSIGSITSSNYNSNFFGYVDPANAYKYTENRFMAIPDNFFDGTDMRGRSDIAVKVENRSYTQLQFKAQLKPDTYYRLSYDYRNLEDVPEIVANGKGTVTVNKLSSNSGGYYRNTYEIYSGSDNTTYSGYDPNTRFRLIRFGGSGGSSGAAYVGNIQLYELAGSGGSTVGANIVGNLNAIFADDNYNTLTGVGNTVNITANEDATAALAREQANGWLIFELNGQFTAGNIKLVKVPAGFFQYKAPAQRLEALRRVILGYNSADGFDPLYDSNGDGTRSNVKDIVHSKASSVYAAGTAQNVTDSMKAALLDTVIMVDDDSSGQGTGKKIYVSNSGSDSNNGTSENTPVASISTANDKASAGDTILLKRGDTWRTTTSANPAFTLKSGVHYTAYGTGAKPELLGSAKNYGGSSNSSGWKETSSGSHIWYYDYGSSSTSSAAMIYFIDADGTVHPGKSIASPDTSKNIYTYSAADLDSDLEFFAPYKANILNGETGGNITAGSLSSLGRMYVYSTSNPATRFPRIEIALGHTLVEGKNGTSASESGVTSLSNVAVKFGGQHGIKSVSGGSNFWINKCEIAYIGGTHQYMSSGGGYNRLGNGVEFGNGYTNGRVYDSYVHDCFDAGLTFQSYGSGSAITFSNIYFCRNVIENCAYNVEFFMNRNNSDSMSNIYIEDNILRDAGYGWGCYDRADGGYRIANIAASKNTYINNVSNTYIRNNIMDCTRMSHVMWTWGTDGVANHAGLTATGNTYVQRKGAADWAVMAYGPIAGGYKYASDKASLAAAVATFDTAPNAVVWLGAIE